MKVVRNIIQAFSRLPECIRLEIEQVGLAEFLRDAIQVTYRGGYHRGFFYQTPEARYLVVLDSPFGMIEEEFDFDDDDSYDDGDYGTNNRRVFNEDMDDYNDEE